MMVDLLKDIEVIENALIAFSEGASDEKYAAFYSLEKLLLKKKDEFRQFEYDMEKEFANDSLKITV